jgi:hypothetical protein
VLRIGAYHLAHGGQGSAPSHAILGSAPAIGADLYMFEGVLRGCGAFEISRGVPSFSQPTTELLACAGLEIGAMIGSAVGITDPRTNAALWMAASPGAQLWFWTDRLFAIAIALEFPIPLARPRFSIDGVGVVYRAEPFSTRVHVGIEVRFP